MGVFALTVVSMVALVAVVEASKCDPNIINKISNSWKQGGLLKEIQAGGQMANVRVTAQLGEGLRCMYTSLKAVASKPGLNLDYINVKPSGEAKTGTIYVQEVDGHLENKWVDGPGNAERYVVFHKPGVFAYYHCQEQGKVGEPQGLVKVTVSEAAAKAADVEAGVAELAKYGIKATKTLYTDCKKN